MESEAFFAGPSSILPPPSPAFFKPEDPRRERQHAAMGMLSNYPRDHLPAEDSGGRLLLHVIGLGPGKIVVAYRGHGSAATGILAAGPTQGWI